MNKYYDVWLYGEVCGNCAHHKDQTFYGRKTGKTVCTKTLCASENNDVLMMPAVVDCTNKCFNYEMEKNKNVDVRRNNGTHK